MLVNKLGVDVLLLMLCTRCSGDNKEKLSRNIRSEYASDFCHDRKSAFTSTT